MKTPLTLLLGGLIILYPFIVYFGLEYVEPRWLGIALLSIVLLRFQLAKSLANKMPWLPVSTILGACVILFSIIINQDSGILFYPVIVNVALFLAFSYSLMRKPCVIETFARITNDNLSEKAVHYTEKVTKVWCIFFILNAAISTYTTLCLSKEAWMLYNGFIAYIAMAIVFLIELLVRRSVQKNNENK